MLHQVGMLQAYVYKAQSYHLEGTLYYYKKADTKVMPPITF
jgi:hypothetical protein